MKNVSNPIYRVLIALVIISVLIVAVVLLGPGPRTKVKIEEGSIGVVIQETALYEKGSSKSKVIKELPEGTRLTLLGANGMMYRVEMDNGNTAWVPAEDIEVQPVSDQ